MSKFRVPSKAIGPYESVATWWDRDGGSPAWDLLDAQQRGEAIRAIKRPEVTFPDGICYAITHIDAHGMRTLTFANQGRNHRRTAEEAQHHLDEILRNTSEDTLGQCMGPRAIGTFEVRPVEC